MVSGAQEVVVTVLGHPTRAGEMCLVNVLSAIGLLFGIETKDDADGFGPVGSVGLRIEQAKIGLKMRAIVFGQVFAVRRLVQKVSLPHLSPSPLARGLGAYG